MTAIALYADSAEEAAVADLLRRRLVRGVTTNPTILRRSGHGAKDLRRLYETWADAGAREQFFQTWGATESELLDRGRHLAALGADVVVKVPATDAGLAAASVLADEGTVVLITAVYSCSQALVAASIRARYIAPYLGRLDDAGMDGTGLIASMAALLQGTGTEVLAASLRSPDAVVGLAARGVSKFTAGLPVLVEMRVHPASEAAAAVFEEDVLD